MIPILSDVEIYGSLTIDKSASIKGNLNITGDIDIDGSLTIDKSASIKGNLDITENVGIEGNLNVVRDVDIDGFLSTDGLTINGRGEVYEWFRVRDKLWLTNSYNIDLEAWLDNNNDNFEIASASIEPDSFKPIYIRQYHKDQYTNDLTLRNTLTLLDENGDTVIPNSLIIGEGITIRYSESETYNKNSGNNFIDIGFVNSSYYPQLVSIIFYNNESNRVCSIIWNGNETIYYHSNETITIKHYRDFTYRFTFSTNLNNSITKAITKKVIIQ